MRSTWAPSLVSCWRDLVKRNMSGLQRKSGPWLTASKAMGTSDLEPGGARVCRQLEWVLKLVLPQGLLVGVESKVKVKVNLLSPVRLFATPWTIAHQAPLSMGFSRQEYWNGLPFLSPGDLPNPGIEPRSPALQTGSFPSEPSRNPERFLRLSSIHFILFPLLCCSEVISTVLSSSSLIESSTCYSSLVPSRVFLISVIVVFIYVCLVFISLGFR